LRSRKSLTPVTNLNRYITHMWRLNVDGAMVARSYDTMAGLGPKAAVVLMQLPARFHFDAERVTRFFAAVATRRKRHAVEPRDPSWLTDDAVAVPRARHAHCVSSTRRGGRRAGR